MYDENEDKYKQYNSVQIQMNYETKENVEHRLIPGHIGTWRFQQRLEFRNHCLFVKRLPCNILFMDP